MGRTCPAEADSPTDCAQQAQQAEQEQQKLLALQAAKYVQRQAAQQADAGHPAAPGPQLATSSSSLQQQPAVATAADLASAAAAAMSADAASVDAAPSSVRKRRRTAVDYVALNKQIEAEAAGQGASLSFATAVPSTAVGVHAGAAVPNERPDSLMDDTALAAEQSVKSPQQPREGDRGV